MSNEERMSKKPVLFISHITEEKRLAEILKEHIGNAFVGMVSIFVSSDGESIPLGNQWFDKIHNALQNAKLTLVLCSNTSIRRPWINFEAGVSFARKIPVIPVCHTNLHLDDLPAPLNMLQATIANQQSGLEQIVERIADLLDADKPPVNWDTIIAEIEGFEREYEDRKQDIQSMPDSSVHSYKREKIERWRSFIEEFDFEKARLGGKEKFGDTAVYSEMRPYMDEEAIKTFESPRMFRVAGGRGEEVYKQVAFDQVSKIESKWGLLDYELREKELEKTDSVHKETETLADRLTDYIGVLSSSEYVPGGAQMSKDTGKKFAEGMVKKREEGHL